MDEKSKIIILSREIVSRNNEIKKLEGEIDIFNHYIKNIDKVKITKDDIEYLGDPKDYDRNK